MANFSFILERLSNIHDKKNYDEEKIKDLINLGKKIDEYFWDNFLTVLNKTEAFSILFGISEEKISNIHRTIKNYLKDNKNNLFDKPNKTRKLL